MKILSLGELTPTTLSLHMAGRPMTQPEGIIEDVFVKVGKSIFLVDFEVIDMEENKQVPLLLDRPFLPTGRALIDVKKGEFILRVGIEEVHFNLNQSMKLQDFERAHCMRVEDIVSGRQEMMYDFVNQNPLEKCMFKSIDKENLDREQPNASAELIETVLNMSEGNEEDIKSSKVKVQEAEKSSEGLLLKELPKHLKYAFLGKEKSKPMIIVFDLTSKKETEVVETLRKYKEAIAWSMEELKGIIPSICMHKILMEENQRPLLNTKGD